MSQEEKEWHDFPQMPNLTILPWLAWGVVIGLAIAGVFYASKALAEPRLAVTQGDVTVTLYDDPCELKDTVTNLQYKATWQEGGRTFQGCWAPRPDLEVVAAFFDDHTVALIPFRDLKRLQGA